MLKINNNYTIDLLKERSIVSLDGNTLENSIDEKSTQNVEKYWLKMNKKYRNPNDMSSLAQTETISKNNMAESEPACSSGPVKATVKGLDVYFFKDFCKSKAAHMTSAIAIDGRIVEVCVTDAAIYKVKAHGFYTLKNVELSGDTEKAEGNISVMIHQKSKISKNM